MNQKKNSQKNSSTSLKKAEIVAIIRQEIAENVPSAIRQIAVESTEIFSGPIPSPSACTEYEAILPGFTDRALTIAEKTQQDDEASRKRGDNYLLIWRMSSLFVAFALAASVIGSSAYLLWNGKNIAGFGILLAGLATMVAAIMSKRQEEKS